VTRGKGLGVNRISDPATLAKCRRRRTAINDLSCGVAGGRADRGLTPS